MNDTFSIAAFALDGQRRELRDATGGLVALRPRAFDVLLFLARRAGALVTKDELLDAVWPGLVVTDDSLVQCIVEIRRALADESHRIVRTEPRRGYRLLAADSLPPTIDVPGDETPFEQQVRFAVTPDGVSIAWALAGDGPPLMRASHWMTHLDLDWCSVAWGTRIRRWARQFRLLRYDERGTGLSDQDATPGTLDECVAAMEAVVEAAGWCRFALVATSGGSPVAIRYAARHPESVSRLVLMGGWARGALARGVAPAHIDAMERLLHDGWGQENPAFRQLITTQMWPAATAEQLCSFNELQRASCTAENAAQLMRRRSEFDASADLARIRCPTLVLHSLRDAAVPFEEARRVVGGIADARLQSFDSPNHTPLIGEPAYGLVLQAIDDFLGEEDRSDVQRATGSGRGAA